MIGAFEFEPPRRLSADASSWCRVQNGLESLEPFTNALSKYRSMEEAPTQDEVAVLNWRRELVVVLVGLDTRPASSASAASTASSSSGANFAADKEAIAAFAGRFSTSHICSKSVPISWRSFVLCASRWFRQRSSSSASVRCKTRGVSWRRFVQ